MVFPSAQDLFLVDHGMFNVVAESKTDPSSASRFYKAVHRARVEGIFPVHELRMKDNIPLLRRPQGHQIRQPLPALKILRPHNTGGSDSSRRIL